MLLFVWKIKVDLKNPKVFKQIGMEYDSNVALFVWKIQPLQFSSKCGFFMQTGEDKSALLDCVRL